MYLYIAYRNLKDHYAQNNLCGGPSYNNDYRFTAICDGVYYLLTKDNMNYAVSKENGDKFIEEVKSKCTGEHPNFFPLVPSLNGKETTAVVEMSQGRNQFYYDMDDELLFQMLDDLKAKSGEPLNERELMDYCYPNPALPEGDFELCEIYHGIYFKPDNTPASVIGSFDPDKTLGLLNEIASRSECEKTEEVVNNVQVANTFPMGAFPGINLMGGMCVNPSVTPGQAAEHASGGARCSYCGADVTSKKFCTECGGKVG